MNQENKTITPDALTAILHKRADEKLHARIALQLPTSAANRERVTLPQSVMADLKHCITEGTAGVTVWLPYILDAAREGLFAAQVESARAAEVAEFLAKVENTAAELDAIREEINQ